MGSVKSLTKICVTSDSRGVKMIGYYSSYNKFVPIGEVVYIKSILTTIETNEQYFLLKFMVNGEEVEHMLPCSNFNKAGLLQLTKYGADITENNVAFFIDWLQQQKYELNYIMHEKSKYIHKYVGWDNFKDTHIFKGNKVYSRQEIISNYNGNYQLEPKGSLEGWIELIKNEVLGHTNLELAVIIGLSSVINGYIGKYVGCENLFISILGESTTGKTTAGMLALSTASIPEQNVMGKETHFKTWNATKNAILNSMIGNHGFPILFDEFSSNKDYSVTDLVYSLANGKDRSRLNKECEERITSDFQTTIISTGEASIFNKTSKNTGLRVRVLEFANLQWTKSAEHSNRIKNGCRQNYGWAIYEVVKFILNCEEHHIIDTFNECHEEFLSNLENPNNFSDRIATRYALILLTILIFNSAFEKYDIQFDYEAIFEVLIFNEDNANRDNSTDLGKKSYDSFIEFVETNRANFIGGLNVDCCYSNECFGKISENDEEIIIPKDKFTNIIKTLGFEDTQTILKKWKDMKLLNHDSGKLTRKRKLYNDGKTIICYVIKYEIKTPQEKKQIEEKHQELVNRVHNRKDKNLKNSIEVEECATEIINGVEYVTEDNSDIHF